MLGVVRVPAALLALALLCPALKLARPRPKEGGGEESLTGRHRKEARAHKRQGLLSPTDLQVLANHVGLYKDKSSKGYAPNVILLTAANSAYSLVLRNWRCYADRLGLDYVVVALDSAMYEELGPEQALLVDGPQWSAASNYRQRGFNIMTANKLKVVQEILRMTRLDVVFSDPDNVFGTDPFAEGDDLGDKIRSGRYQYIYQQNHHAPPRKEDVGAEVAEANTGFYYVTGSKKMKGIQNLFSAAIQECDNNRTIDDQANFWAAMRTIRAGAGSEKYGGRGGFKCSSLCGGGPTCPARPEEVLDYCEMDPWAHATGWFSTTEPVKGMNSYHANFVWSIPGKIAKLKVMGFWECINDSSISYEASLSDPDVALTNDSFS